ncbi:MAG: acylphosphatase [Deltaproteobacteria bacterium]|nr:acylphosphatase [Deltaproteobacteria bacterium]
MAQASGVRVRLHITGEVQGVFYRVTACEQATALGLTGWVKNNFDGSVEALAEGAEGAVEQFISWCRRGPPAAAVAEVAVRRGIATGEFESFNVVH